MSVTSASCIAAGHIRVFSRNFFSRSLNGIRWLTSLRGGISNGAGAITFSNFSLHHSLSFSNSGCDIGSPSRWLTSGSSLLSQDGLGHTWGVVFIAPRCSPLSSSQRGLFSASFQGAIWALAQVFHPCNFVAWSPLNVRVLIEPLPRVFTT